jgi:hypothetical protein
MSIRIQELRINMRSWLSSLWHQVKKEADGLQYVFKPDLFRFDYRGWAHSIQHELRELLAKLLATQCVVRVEAKCLNRSPQEAVQKALESPGG